MQSFVCMSFGKLSRVETTTFKLYFCFLNMLNECAAFEKQ